mgnify:FL=1
MVAQAEVAELLGLVGLVVAEAVTVTVAIVVGMAVGVVGSVVVLADETLGLAGLAEVALGC